MNYCVASVAVTVAVLCILLQHVVRVITETELREFSSPLSVHVSSSSADDSSGVVTKLSSEFCNFDGQVCCTSASPVLYPRTVDEVQQMVRNVASSKSKRLRVVGAGHSMSTLVCDAARPVDEDLVLMSLDKMRRVLHVSRVPESQQHHRDASAEVGDPTLRTTATVTVEGGIRLVELNKALRLLGLGLKNMGLIQEQSIAGLIATGVHGTGVALPSVSNIVTSMRVVSGNGSVVLLSATSHAEIFRHARLHLGLFGVVVEVTLEVTDAFGLERENRVRPMADIMPQMEHLVHKYRNFQFWWIPGTDVALENRIDLIEDTRLGWDSPSTTAEPRRPPPECIATKTCKFDHVSLTASTYGVLEKALSTVKVDLLFDVAVRLTSALPILSPYFLRLIPLVEPDIHVVGWSADILTFPGINYHTVRYTEAEYFVPMKHAKEAIQVFQRFTERPDCPINSIDPFRTVRGDDIPLSPLRDMKDGALAISFVLVRRPDIFEPCSRAIEAEFLRLGGRPHWGKRHHAVETAQDVERLFGTDALVSFRSAVAAVDPRGMFATRELQHLLGL